MTRPVRFIGISGSLRAGSTNTALLRAVRSLVPEGVEFSIADIGSLPLFNSDLEADGPVPAVQSFKQQLRESDALVIASPEYNYSIPGVLKNALDWASRGKDSPLQNKPVAIMGATPGMMGTVRMQMHLRQVFLFNNMRPVNKPEVFVAQAPSKFDAEGRLTDERTAETIRQQMQALSDLARQ
ncbi:MAG: NAD(P)H-dependent oxidoreductase [Bacteroidetes bacterium]|nr:NAD(P)H-dependent oxidoreductase [Bacteroidota bacterium]